MAQTLKFGNKTWATKVGSTLAYNDENGNYKPLPFAFTRSTSATRVNKEGLIEVVTNDRPRIDYTDTSDGVLLLEKASTNLVTYSEDFTNSSWTKDNTTITSNQVISPDGGLNASLITANGLNSDHTIYQQPSLSSQTHTLSAFVKKNTQRYVHLAINRSNASTLWVSSVFDLDTLDKADYSNGSGFNDGVSKIENYGNDWYRISLTAYLPDSTGYLAFIGFAEDMTAPNISRGRWQFTTSNSFYIWGAMLEQNSVASSYIPTQGSATTRVAETASDSGNSEVFNDSEGVLFVNHKPIINTTTNSATTVNNGTANRVYIGNNTGDENLQFFMAVGGSSKINVLTPYPKNAYSKIAFSYKSGNSKGYVNGFQIFSDNVTFSDFTTLNELSFNNGSIEVFKGSVKEVGYYNTILTDLELETLTSYKSWTSMVNELNLNIIYNG